MNKKRMYLNNVPAVFVSYHEDTAKQKGAILFFHGLGASKDIQMSDLESLAQHGFLAIGIDNVGHGERRYSDFEERFSKECSDVEKNFQEAMYQTVLEIPGIVDFLIKENLVVEDKIAITGISMGGFIVYGGILIERRFKAAVPILGSPLWKENSHSPHLFIEQFYPMPLLSLNAGKDESVPPQYARELHKNLAPYYAQAPHKISYEEYPESGHFMREEDWNSLWKKAIDWFDKWL